MNGIGIGIGIDSGIGGGIPNGNPNGLTLTVLSDTSIQCDWTNGATNQDGTYVFISTDNETFTNNATALGSLTTKNLTGLTENTTYYVKVVHYKGIKLSEYSSTISTTTYLTESYSLIQRSELALTLNEKTVVNKTIADLKTYSLWDKLELLQLWFSPTEQFAKLNYKGTSFTSENINSCLFTKSYGFKGDGSSSYINTKYNPSLSSVYLQNSASVGVFVFDTGINGTKNAFGVVSGTTTINTAYIHRFTNLKQVAQINCGSYASAKDDVLITPTIGITTLSRNESAKSLFFQNKDQTAENAHESNGIPNGELYVFCTDSKGTPAQYTDAFIMGVWAGSGLTKADHDNLCDILNYHYNNIANKVIGNVLVVGDSTITAYLSQHSVGSLLRGATLTDISYQNETTAQQKTRYDNLSSEVKSDINYAFVQIGLNDLDPGESAATMLSRYQGLITDINTNSPNSLIICGTLTPCKQRLIDLYGGTDGLTAYQKWLDINEAIKGNGINAITGIDFIASSHTTTLNDGNGNLSSTYEIAGTIDHIHENNLGRIVISQAWIDILNL